jgi:hypothetical protein
MAPLSLRLPLVIEVQDDHAVTTVELESRRVSRLGFTDPAKREIVPLPAWLLNTRCSISISI